MQVSERIHGFHLNDGRLLHHEARPADFAERAAPIAGRHRHITHEPDFALGKFDGESGRVDLLVQTDAKYPLHFDGGTDDLVGEVVVLRVCGVHSRPSSTSSAARSKARALASVSFHSSSGTESATTPAAACTCSIWSFTMPVRMAIATSMSPA